MRLALAAGRRSGSLRHPEPVASAGVPALARRLRAGAAVRVDPVLVVAAAVALGGAAAAGPAPVGAAALAAALLLRGRVTPLVLALALAGLALSAGRAAHAVEAFEQRRVAFRDALGEPLRCSAEGVVVASPVVRRGVTVLLLDLSAPSCEGRTLPDARVRVHGGPADLARGDRVVLVAQLGATRLFRNAELPDPAPRAARRAILASGGALAVERVERGAGLGALIDRARAAARERIVASFAPAAAPMARALVLGESDLDPEDDAAIRLSGLAHLLAVSGTHLVFAVATLVAALRALLLRWHALAVRVPATRVAAALGVPLALLYADFAGGSGSAWRAAFMLAASFLAQALGRQPMLARSFAASLLAGVLLDPLVAFDLSFLLSAAATSGLVVLGRPLGALTERISLVPLRWVAGSMATTVASMVPCAPLLLVMSPELTAAGLLANVIAAPLGEVVALPLCLLHPLLAFAPALEHGVATVASGALLTVKAIAHASAGARWAAVALPPPSAWHLVVLGVGGLALLVAGPPASASGRVAGVGGTGEPELGPTGWWGRWPWWLGLAVGWLGVEAAVRGAGTPRDGLRVSAVDVGQGDSTLVDFPDGALMLVDAGGFMGSPVDPGRDVVLPLLAARRRARIDVLVLSHPHPDHFLGLVTVAPAVSVGEFWDTGQGEREGAGPQYRALLAGLRARGVPIRRPAELCGQVRRFGAATVEVLAPCPDFVPRRDANDNSLVLRVALGERVFLLTGDAEAEEEHELIRAWGAHLRADYLKVGHHGSRTSSTTPFLAAVAPTWATLSCGTRNPYGHPHAEAVERLTAAGVAPLRLDHRGGVTLTTDGRRLDVRAFSAPR